VDHQVGLQLDLVWHDVRTHLSVILSVCLTILVKFFLIREENLLIWIRWFSSGAQKFSIAGRVAYSANILLNIKAFFLHDVLPKLPSFSMRPAKYFYDKQLPKYLDPKTVLIYLPHPVYENHYESRSKISLRSDWLNTLQANSSLAAKIPEKKSF
jgi:hypothetical protein